MSKEKQDDTNPTIDVNTGTSYFINLRKQAKYVVLGGIGMWYWQVSVHLIDVLKGSGWTRLLAMAVIGLYLATVGMFAYMMILPARGVQVDYVRWQKDIHLQSLIPLLTASIVAGFITMVITLSPLCAPSPPSAALSQRLMEAANAAGGNLQKASSGVQLLLSDAARSLGLSSSTATLSTELDVTSLLRALRLPDGEALAGRLGVRKEHTKVLLSTLESYQNRAQAWKEGNVSVLGWTGALIGSASAFTFMFGIVGLFGLFTPKTTKRKSVRQTL